MLLCKGLEHVDGAGELEVEEVCKTRRWVFKGEARSDRARGAVGRCGPWQLTSWLVATVDVEKAKLETGHVLIGAQWEESRSRTRLTLARTPWLEPLVVVTHRKAERRPARGYMAWNSCEGALRHRAEKSSVVAQDYRECERLRVGLGFTRASPVLLLPVPVPFGAVQTSDISPLGSARLRRIGTRPLGSADSAVMSLLNSNSSPPTTEATVAENI